MHYTKSMKQHDYQHFVLKPIPLKRCKDTHKDKMFNLNLVMLNLWKNLNQEMNFWKKQPLFAFLHCRRMFSYALISNWCINQKHIHSCLLATIYKFNKVDHCFKIGIKSTFWRIYDMTSSNIMWIITSIFMMDLNFIESTTKQNMKKRLKISFEISSPFCEPWCKCRLAS
jgi:hypothetical protein